MLPNLIHVRRARAPLAPSACASARCSTSCRSGTRCASPRTSPSPTSSPAAAWSSASAAARCRARRGRSAPWSPPATTRCRPSTTASTARCSRSRWRSSSSPGRKERFSYRGKHFVFPPDDVPDRGTLVNDLTLIPQPDARRRRSTNRSRRPRRSSTCPRPATRPSTGCSTPTAKRRSGTLRGDPRRGGHAGRSGRGPLPRAERPRRRAPARRRWQRVPARRTTSSASSSRPTAGSRNYLLPDGDERAVRLPARARGLDGAAHRGDRLARRRRGGDRRLQGPRST